MIRSIRTSSAAGLLLLALAGCAGKSAPVPTATDASQAPSGPNSLSAIEVKPEGAGTSVVISGSQAMSPNIFKLTDPDRIIVDLTNTVLGSVTGPIQVNASGVAQITVDQFNEGQSSLSRVVIGLSEPLEYEVSSEGTRLVLKVAPGAGAAPPPPPGLPDVAAMPAAEPSPPVPEAPAAPAEVPAAPVETAEVPAAPVEAPAAPVETAEVPAAPVDVPVAEAVPAGEPAAKKLTDVQYSASGSGTTVTLVADGAIADFKDFILKDPNRLVIDLSGLKNGYAGGANVALETPEIRQVRLGKSQGSLRVVMDVTGTEKPAYTIDRSGNSLVVNVAAAQTAPAPESAPDVAFAPEASPAEAAPEAAPAPEVASAPARKVQVTSVGFRQLKDVGKSRLTIGLSHADARYTTREEAPGTLVVEIANARFAKAGLKRTITTKEFQTAITDIVPREYTGTRDVQFQIRMDQQVPYTVNQEGSSLVVDVDIPAQMARATTPNAAPPAAAEAAPAAELAPATMRDELLMSGNQVTPAGGTPGAKPRDYSYVRESFMSDSAGGGEPLSEMGAILAGEYRGRRFTGRKISLDFKDAEIRAIFRLLADISKLNLIISDDVQGRVTVRLENVPWDQAFAIILQTKGLWFEKYGNIVRIAPADKLRAERELAAAATKAAQAAKPLDVLFKPVSYATAGDLMKQVKTVLSDRGTVDIDSRTNTLIIKDIRENLEQAKRLVEILDTQTPQVTIESRIVEATTSFTRSFGVIWGGAARFSSATGNPTGVFFPNSVTVNPTTGTPLIGQSFSGLPVALNYPSPLGQNAAVGLRFGSINGVMDLDLALAFNESQGNAKLISAPKVTVLDNRTANIQAGSKIPFLTQTANAGSNVRFESATTSLDVTPHITNDGSISMKITATRNEPNFAQLVQGNPLVDQRTASTEVLVKSGNTTVLGGIYSIRTGQSREYLPGVSQIPLIGWLFKNYNKELKRSELLIFVTPRIVGDEREAVKDVRG